MALNQKFVRIADGFYVDADYENSFRQSGLTSIDAVFTFSSGRDLVKTNLAPYRSRIKFQLNPQAPGPTVFLKRYDRPPVLVQLKNWLRCRAVKSLGISDFETACRLQAAGIPVPKTIAFGCERGLVFEKRSFIIIEKIPRAESLERKVPEAFAASPGPSNLKQRRHFIEQLALFIKKFHAAGFRHRDLYLCHIFYGRGDRFYLIDLSRVSKPLLAARRLLVKDIAQLYYSAPRSYFTRTDRLRFYLSYTGRTTLTNADKRFIRKVLAKAERMARHDRKHNRPVPFVEQ